MERNVYERYGLRSNPFRDLSSETLESVDIFHVDQHFDEELTRMKEEIFFKENKVVVAILGGLGVGKTQRLLLAASEAEQKDAFWILRTMSIETQWVVQGIVDLMIQHAKIGAFQRIFSAPKWYKGLVKKKKHAMREYDPEEAGRVMANALNANAPAFLLINDFHHLSRAADAERFLHALHILFDHIDPGVMVMISSDQEYFLELMKHHPSLNERINRQMTVPMLSDNEASLMLAKRLLEKRLVDGVDPLYPLTSRGVSAMNQQVKGNPRHLLKLADIVIEYAAKKRAIMIDEVMVNQVLTLRKNHQLDITFADNGKTQYSTPIVELPPQQVYQSRSTNTSKSSGTSLKDKMVRKQNPQPTTISSPVQPHDITGNTPFKQIEDTFEDLSSNQNSLNIEQEQIGKIVDVSKRRVNSEKKQKEKKQKTKLKLPKKSERPSMPQTEEEKNDIHELHQDEHLCESQSEQASKSMAKIKCPECQKVFGMELDDDIEVIRCPYCEFVGSLTD